MKIPRLMGTKQVNSTAAEIYKLQPNYCRFEQKNNFIYRSEWDSSFTELSDAKWLGRRTEKISQDKPGFSILDWAFLMGACANLYASDYIINVPNKGGTSWNPIKKHTIWGENIQHNWKPETSESTKIIKRMAQTFGADDVGICSLERKYVYSHYYDPEKKESYPIRFSDEPGYATYRAPSKLEDGTLVIPETMKSVIVLVHEMDYEGMQTAPTLTQMATTLLAYSKIAFTTASLAEFIRALGYNAIPSANCTASNIPLAIDAGLGEFGRNAKLIHPWFGPRCRISKVITDLPLNVDKPISFGATSFCNKCKKCATLCPSGAISNGEPSFEPEGDFSPIGVSIWRVNHGKCREFMHKFGTNCGICIRVCSFNKPKKLRHWVVKSMLAGLPDVFKPLFVWADGRLSYDRFVPSKDYWKQDLY